MFGMTLFGPLKNNIEYVLICKQNICFLNILFGILSKLKASLMRNNFPKRPSGALLHTLSKSYDVTVGSVPQSFEAV